MLSLAARHDWILGVVGWIDFEARGAAARVEAMAETPKLVGLRPMIQTIPDEDWMLRDALTPAFEAMVGTGACASTRSSCRPICPACRA